MFLPTVQGDFMAPTRTEDVDTIEAGQGELVLRIHSSAAGARQGRKRIVAQANPDQPVRMG